MIFLIFVAHSKMEGEKQVIRYIGHGQDYWDIDEHHIKHTKSLISQFHNDLNWYLRTVTKGEIVDDNPPSNAIVADPESFVKFFFRHIYKAL